MREKSLLVASVFCAVFFGVILPASSANVVVQPLIRVTDACGFIKDTHGEMIANARVLMISRDGTRREIESDKAGYFLTDEFSGKLVEFQVTSTGLVTLNFHADQVRAGACHKKLYMMFAIGDGDSFVSLQRKQLPKVKK